jgi:hypothetical protein
MKRQARMGARLLARCCGRVAGRRGWPSRLAAAPACRAHWSTPTWGVRPPRGGLPAREASSQMVGGRRTTDSKLAEVGSGPGARPPRSNRPDGFGSRGRAGWTQGLEPKRSRTPDLLNAMRRRGCTDGARRYATVREIGRSVLCRRPVADGSGRSIPHNTRTLAPRHSLGGVWSGPVRAVVCCWHLARQTGQPEVKEGYHDTDGCDGHGAGLGTDERGAGRADTGAEVPERQERGGRGVCQLPAEGGGAVRDYGRRRGARAGAREVRRQFRAQVAEARSEGGGAGWGVPERGRPEGHPGVH